MDAFTAAIADELRHRYPSAFDGSDRIERGDMPIRVMADWVLAFHLLAALTAPEPEAPATLEKQKESA